MPRSPQFSLRIRFAIGMAAMLLPLVLSIAVGHLYLLPRVRQSLEKVIEEVLEEMVPVVHLQNALLKAAMPANDYLIHGDPAERERFATLSQEVDQAFEEALAAPYAMEEERALVQTAWEEWQQARSLSEAILALPNPVGDPMGAEEMERLDAHVDRAVDCLDQQHVLAHHEAGDLLAAARADRQRGGFLIASIVTVALGIAVAASLGLAHSVLAPIRALRRGAIRFGEGDLSYRVAVDRQDELGQLAKAFNEMADHLEKSQEMLHRRDAVLEAVSFSAERFLKGPAWQENIQEVLERLGQATEVSRVYIFENQTGDAQRGSLLTSQRYEWAAPGVAPQIDNPDLQNFPLGAAGFDRWEEMLGNGELVCGHVREFPESEREVLAAQGIQSIAVVPIFIGQTWWGFIGFDECQAEREWSAAEREALKTAADMLGAALKRQRVEAELQTYARQQAALFKISADLAAALDETDICQKVVRGLHEALGYDHVGLFLVDQTTGERVLPEGASVGWLDAPPNWRIPPGQGVSERALQDGQLHYTPDVTRAPRYVPGVGTGAEVDAPIRIGEQVVGVLIVESGQPHAFDQHDFAVLTAAANQTSLALQRAREHQAVKEAEAHYHDLFNTVPVGIFQTTLDGQYVLANPALARIYGYESPEELMANVSDLNRQFYVQPNRRAEFIRQMEEHDAVWEFESETYCKDGSTIWVLENARTIRDVGGRIVGFEGTTIDITERQRAEEALHASEKRFRSLFEDSPISLWEEDFSLVATYLDELRHSGVTDFRAYLENHPEAVAHCATMVKVVDVNRGTLRLYKAKSKEDFLAGLNVVLSEEAIPTFREELIALAEGKTRFEGEAINQTLTGDKIHVVLSWSVAPGDDKGSRRLFVSISDITGRKQAEEKLAANVTELEQHNREIKLLNEMGDLLQTCLAAEEAYAVVARSARLLFPAESGALCMIAPSRNLVEAVVTWGESPPQEHVFTPDDCWALRRGQVHSVVDPHSELLCRHVSRPVTNGYLCVPMMAQGETLGILHLQGGKQGPSRTTEAQATHMATQQRLAVSLAEHLALALANLRLREALRQQAIRDPLTGLFNRRYLEETLERELRRAERRQAPLGITMLDLDHFKKFNDTFGHAAGDLVLRETGAFLRTSVRAEDIACRYGGEEFVLILPEAPLDDTLKRAEQLREGIKQLQVRHHDQTLGAVTVSLGVAAFPEHGSTTEAIMQAADAALYRAKREGRDRVVVASGGWSTKP